MRYPGSEKLKIIQLVEQSHLPVRATLDKLGITRATFYRWYNAYQRGGPEARVAAFVEHYNHLRAHESLSNLTPADGYFGRGEAIVQDRARIKRPTPIDRCLRHHAQAA